MRPKPHEKECVNPETGEVTIRNANFIQFYPDHLILIRDMVAESPNALRIFMWIVEKMENHNKLIVSFPAMAEALKISERTAKYGIAHLKSKNFLTTAKSGNTNVYIVNSNIVWKTYADKKQFSEFSAHVYITASEQEIEYDVKPSNHVAKSKTRQSVRRGKQLDDIVGAGSTFTMFALSIFSFYQALLTI